jgi:uncharacterized protein with HEPN domain
MRSKSPSGALHDIEDNIELARSFVAGLTYEIFCNDRRTVYAVTRCLEIISEASRRLPPDLKARHPDVPWTDIAGAGSIYRHDYDAVIHEVLWQTVHHSLEPLALVVEQELGRLGETRKGF